MPAWPLSSRQGEGHQIARRAVGAVQRGHAGVEEPADTLDDPLGDLVRVQRLRDDAVDLGEALGGSPPALGLLEETGVLDRDAGLVGQIGHERERVVVEFVAELAVDIEGPQGPMPDTDRDRHLGADLTVLSPRPVFGQEPRVCRAVGGDDRLAGGGDPAADGLPDADPLPGGRFCRSGRRRDPDEELALHEPEAGLPAEQLRGSLGDAPQHGMKIQTARDTLGDGDQRTEIPAPSLRLVEEPGPLERDCRVGRENREELDLGGREIVGKEVVADEHAVNGVPAGDRHREIGARRLRPDERVGAGVYESAGSLSRSRVHTGRRSRKARPATPSPGRSTRFWRSSGSRFNPRRRTSPPRAASYA